MDHPQKNNTNQNGLNILSLFDGISCARVALDRVGIKINNFYASEIDKWAIAVSKKNYPDIIHMGDIKNIGHGTIARLQNKMICDIDLIVGGFPCQDLSIAKKDRKGLSGERSGLFWEMVRIHKEVKPKWFIYENVASMSKENKEIILNTLKEIDKNAYVIEINGALVSAQNRRRLFFTNILNITQPEDKGILLKDILEEGAKVDKRMIINGKSFSLTASYNGAVEWNSVAKKQRTMVRIGKLNKGGQGDRIYSVNGKSVNLSANGGGRGAKTGLYIVQTPRGKNKGGKRALDGKVPTLSSSSWEHNNKLSENEIIRKLTPVECERLTTLPDDFSKYGINDKGEEILISNTQRYRMCGNAFLPDVISWILSFIPMKWIKN